LRSRRWSPSCAQAPSARCAGQAGTTRIKDTGMAVLGQGGNRSDKESPLAIICGGGSRPLAVADIVAGRGRRVMLFPLRGWADPEKIARYPHHWIGLAQIVRLQRLARQAGCRELVFIGAVLRPSPRQLRPDLGTLRLLPRIVKLFWGGDDHLLSGLGRLFEEAGFHVLGAHEVAPEILVPQGALGRLAPTPRHLADIARGLSLIAATGPFDVGQAVVVADNRVLAIEAAEGTDRMLARIAEPRPTAGPLKIFLIATEESGDRLGAALMRALRRASRDALQFAGIGGREMAAEGLTSLYPIGDMAFMGITAILRRAPTIWR